MRNKLGQFKERGKNEVTMHKDYAIVWTTNIHGNRNVGYKVDKEDLELILQHRWSVDTDGYAKHRSIKMHRLIIGAKTGDLPDHINQDKTDNRKKNLRIISHSLNMRNSTKTNSKVGHKHIIKRGKKYSVQLKCRGERYYIGKIVTLEEAIQRRNDLYDEIKYFEE